MEISVIIPTHNRLSLLQHKMQSLEAQQLPPSQFEVIVIADGCTDGTQEWLRDYQPPFGLRWSTTPGVGPAKARNAGINLAQGKFLCLSDDDVWLAPQTLKLFQEAQLARPAVYIGAMQWENGEKPALSYRLGGLHWTALNGANSSVPVDVVNCVGGFWEGFSGYGVEDIELGYRLAKVGVKFYYLPEAKSIHAGSPPISDMNRARSAGQQAMQAYRHHRDWVLGFELGVHPVLLGLKLAILPWAKGLIGRRGDYELAYAWGAWEAYEARRTR